MIMNIVKVKPIELTKETSYIAGVIIGDGHISNSSKSKTDMSKDYKIVIDISDKEYLHLICEMIKSVISTKSELKSPKKRGNRKERLYFQFRNKSFFYFLVSLGIPAGAKSAIVEIPASIKNSSEEIKKHFLAGLFDTDGGFRGETLGFTTASKNLSKDTGEMLNEFLIKHSSERWKNKKYNRYYYGIKIHRTEIDKFLKTFPFRNKEKLIRIFNRFNVGMPERPNGID
jgi:intein/homing endonuclease